MPRRARIVAGPRLAPAAVAGLPLALGGGAVGLSACLAFDAVLMLGAAIEGRSLASRVPTLERRVAPQLRHGVAHTVVLRVHNPTPRTVRVCVRDDLPEGWEAEPAEHRVELPPWAHRDLSYTVVPPRRGRASFGALHVRIDGPLGLGAAIVEIEAATEIKVVPSVAGASRTDLAARTGVLQAGGVRPVRRPGGGGEFSHLREYVKGDPFRDLDWKSSARRQRPVTRVLQEERSQQVVLALDVGRMMATRLDDGAAAGGVSRTKLDHAIQAALRLSQVAMRHGDRVGLVVFAGEVRAFVPPSRGPVQQRRLLDALHAVEAEPVHVDFRRFVEFTRERVPRRSLVVIFSDLLDEAYAGPLAEHAAVLRTRHLAMCVTMHDPVAEALAVQPPNRLGDVYERAAAADLLAERRAVEARLRHAGVAVVSASAGELAVATLGRYLEIKARHAL